MTLPGGLVSTQALLAWLGYEQPAAVSRWLRRHGVRFWQGKAGPVTTLDEIQRQLSGREGEDVPPLEFDDDDAA